MPAPSASKQVGRRGEARAARFLRKQGYRILTRGFRTRYGEVDIIAREGPVLCFIEVKTRTQPEFGSPAEAVTPAKTRRLAQSAQLYLAKQKLGEVPVRFDVVAVVESAAGVECELFRGAFESPFRF
jgi:putative endonuclease